MLTKIERASLGMVGGVGGVKPEYRKFYLEGTASSADVDDCPYSERNERDSWQAGRLAAMKEAA